MPLFEPLSEFYQVLVEDNRIRSTHISMYMALLQTWNQCEGNNPFRVSRSEIMRLAKICSRHTYNRYMHELDDYGYIRYLPSSHPYDGSEVYLRIL